MKKFAPVFIFIAAFLFSCQGTDEVSPESIAGTWIIDSTSEDQPGYTYREELVFNADGTYELSLRLIETGTMQTVGYNSLITGRYVLDKNKLFRVDIKQYGLDGEHELMDRDDLVELSSIDELPVIKVSLNKTGDALTLDFTQSGCAPGAVCVDYLIYYKSSGN